MLSLMRDIKSCNVNIWHGRDQVVFFLGCNASVKQMPMENSLQSFNVHQRMDFFLFYMCVVVYTYPQPHTYFMKA